MTPPVAELAPAPLPVTRRTQVDSFRLSVGLLLIVMIAQRAIGLVRNVLLCGMLSESELGRWSLANNYLGWAAPFVVLGLPGSFGRLSESFRKRGELRSYLRHITLVCLGLTSLATALHLFAPGTLAHWVYNDPQQTRVIPVLGAVLALVIGLNFINEFLTSVRSNRIVSRLNLIQSLLFAVFSVALLQVSPWREESVLIAFGLASAVAAVVGMRHVIAHWRDAPQTARPVTSVNLWKGIAAVAAWIWIGNAVANLFDCTDQFLIKHYLPLPPETIDAMIGQLYASRVLPVMIVSVAMLLGGCLLPYLIADREAGCDAQVQQRMNSIIKVGAIAFTAIAALTHVASPLVFRYLLRGKYDDGLALMPWAFVQYSWFGLAAIAGKYLICIDRLKSGILPLLLGLISAAALVAFAAPRWGLPGVAIAMTVANGVAFFALLAVTAWCGMRWDAGTLIASTVPLAMIGGGWFCLAVLAIVSISSWKSSWLVKEAERVELLQWVEPRWAWFSGRSRGAD